MAGGLAGGSLSPCRCCLFALLFAPLETFSLILFRICLERKMVKAHINIHTLLNTEIRKKEKVIAFCL